MTRKTFEMIENIHPDFETDPGYFEGKTSEIFEKILNITGDYEHLKPFKKADFDFDIIFCDDEKITEINSRYRKKNSPTDVITFALFFDSEQKIVVENVVNLGEIIISIDRAKIQAEVAKHSFEKEVLTLIAHGILHLLGFDHQTQADFDFVVSVQNNICNSDFCSNSKF